MSMLRHQSTWSGAIVLGMGLLALDVLLYLAFVAPRIIAGWEAQARPLGTWDRVLAGASAFCSAYGFILVPMAAATMVAGVIWTVVQGRAVSAGQPARTTH